MALCKCMVTRLSQSKVKMRRLPNIYAEEWDSIRGLGFAF